MQFLEANFSKTILENIFFTRDRKDNIETVILSYEIASQLAAKLPLIEGEKFQSKNIFIIYNKEKSPSCVGPFEESCVSQTLKYWSTAILVKSMDDIPDDVKSKEALDWSVWPVACLVQFLKSLPNHWTDLVVSATTSLQESSNWKEAFHLVFATLSDKKLHLVSSNTSFETQARKLSNLDLIEREVQKFACTSFVQHCLPNQSQVLVILMDSSLSEQQKQQHRPVQQRTPRDFVIDDLQLPEATTVFSTDPLSRPLEIMESRDFTQLPVLNERRRIVGLISKSSINATRQQEGKVVKMTDMVRQVMYKFPKSSQYVVVTPDTNLADLEGLFDKTASVFVTDGSGKHCLAVVTRQDVESFLARQ